MPLPTRRRRPASQPRSRTPSAASRRVKIVRMIDSHCHLADETFATDLPDVVGRARAAGLERVLVVLEACNEKEAEQGDRLLELWPEAVFAIGVHPHQAHQ